MLIHSFSYVGAEAEDFIRKINADILFFSCHGLSDNGLLTDRASEEVNLRKVMFTACKQKILLCDSSKIGKTCFYNMGHVRDVDAIICERELPPHITQMMQ